MLQCVIDCSAGLRLEVGVCEMICDYAKYECDEHRLPYVDTRLRTEPVYFNKSSTTGQCKVFYNGKVLWKGVMSRGYDGYTYVIHTPNNTMYIVFATSGVTERIWRAPFVALIMKFVNGVIVQSNEYNMPFIVTHVSYDGTCIQLYRNFDSGASVPIF
jgi:hypothetical protein